MKPKNLLGIMGILLMAAGGCAGVQTGRAGSSVENLQDEVVKAARSLVGISCPAATGIDCSRYIPELYHKATGTLLPPKPADLAKFGRPVTKEDLRPGDIVYFMIESQESAHPGIYLGGGDFVHISSSDGSFAIQNLDQDYWRIRFLGGRRVLRWMQS